MNFKFKFGKYKGEELSNVPKDYIEWKLLQNVTENLELRKELDRREGAARESALNNKVDLYMVFSAGQTGTDQAALRVAKGLGISTGGYAFEDFMTDDGRAPWLGKEYELSPSVRYHDQYGVNAANSDATLIFGQLTGGSRLVSHMCNYADLPWKHIRWPDWSEDPWQVAEWVRSKNVGVLHICGNSERKNPGIGKAVEGFLKNCLEAIVGGDKRKF